MITAVQPAQRGAEDRYRLGSDCLEPGDQVIDEGGVAGQLMGAVVDDSDPGASVRRGQRCPGSQAGLGHRDRREEALAGAQHGVGQKGRQLAQILRSAFGQVAQRLLRDTGRDCGSRHQLRVRVGLAAQHDGRNPRAQDRSQALGPRCPAPEQSDHGETHLGQQRGQLFHGDPGRVGASVVRAAGLSGQQVGVGCRQEQNHARAPIASAAMGSKLVGWPWMMSRT